MTCTTCAWLRRLRALPARGRRALGSRVVGDASRRARVARGRAGAARDLDVLLEHLRAEAAALDGDQAAFSGVLGRLEADRADAREQVLAALAAASVTPSPRRALGRGEGAARQSAGRSSRRGRLGRVPAARQGGRKARRRADRRRAAPRPNQGETGRYAAELAEPVSGKPVARFVKSAKKFQDVVGDHQDAVVAEERSARSPPSSTRATRCSPPAA